MLENRRSDSSFRIALARSGGQQRDAAAASFGIEPTEAERASIQEIAGEANRCRRAAKQAKRKVEKLTEHEGAAREMRVVVGKTTAAVLVAALGDPRRYHCAAAYRKALGLNLREYSSGEHKGGLHIPKRGPGIARLYLYMAALRLLKSNAIVAAWYAKKVRRQGGQAKNRPSSRSCGKLAAALWHVARGAAFDARKALRRLTAEASGGGVMNRRASADEEVPM